MRNTVFLSPLGLGLLAGLGQFPAHAAEPTSPSPLGSPGEWVSSADYPAQALREERSGTTGFTLTVGADGTVKDCLVTVSSGFAELDTTTCSLIRERARFTPAKDKKGEAVQGSWSSRVRWEIPQTSPNPRPGSYTIEFVVEADGSLSNCVSSVQGGSAGGTPPITECPAYTFTPYLDATGKAVRKKVKLTNSVEVKDAP